MKNLPRFMEKQILDAMQTSPIVFLNGARQTGKSTLVQGLSSKIGKKNPANYLTFDRPTLIASAEAEPEAFLKAHEDTIILDEVQLAPSLFRALKIVADELRLNDKKNANGRFLLTGSANILTLPELSKALVGRMNVMTLYPFAAAEACQGKGDGLQRLFNLDFNSMEDKGLSLTRAIELATYPEISGKEEKLRKVWFEGYLSTILQRDVRTISDIEKISVLPGLLRILATRSASLINDSDIARDLGLNSVTAKTYRNILKMMFLSFDIEPWYRNIGKRMVKSKKGFMMDTLMLCHLLGLDINEIKRSRPELFGHILENFVACELLKLLSFGQIDATMHHFRTSDGKEVDFILERKDGCLLALEVKKSEIIHTSDFNSIRLIQENVGEQFIGGVILYSGKEVLPFGKKLWAVPHYVLWQ